MAFTTEEKLSISKIVPITPTLLDAHLTSLGASLTADVITAVQTELTRWETSGAEFIKIWPMESNKGIETNSEDTKADIRNNIITLLELYDYATVDSSVGTFQVANC